MNEKQKRFCMYYVQSFNATRAYQKAYGCSWLSSNMNAYKLMKKKGVLRLIDELKAEQTRKIKLDIETLFRKYMDIAFADLTDFITFGKKKVPLVGPDGPLKGEDGEPMTKEINYVDFKESSEVDGTLINELKIGRDGCSVKLSDRMRAMEWLSQFVSEKEKNRLIVEKLKVEIEKLKAETEQVKKEKEKVSPPVINIVDSWRQSDE